jgi:hypothetical protein
VLPYAGYRRYEHTRAFVSLAVRAPTALRECVHLTPHLHTRTHALRCPLHTHTTPLSLSQSMRARTLPVVRASLPRTMQQEDTPTARRSRVNRTGATHLCRACPHVRAAG